MERGGGHWRAAVGVIAVGFASAMFFHEPEPGVFQTNGHASGPADTAVQWMGGERPSLQVPAESPGPAAPSTDPRPRTQLSKTPERSAAPEIQGEYGGLLQDYARRQGSASGRGPIPATSGDATRLAIPASVSDAPRAATTARRLDPRVAEPAPRAAEPPAIRGGDRASTVETRPVKRHHPLRDGDTLAAIALRYYGDAAWASRIFAANRDLLTDPEILPVGKRLVLPDFDERVGDQPLVPLDVPAASTPPIPSSDAPTEPLAPEAKAASNKTNGDPVAPRSSRTRLEPIGGK